MVFMYIFLVGLVGVVRGNDVTPGAEEVVHRNIRIITRFFDRFPIDHLISNALREHFTVFTIGLDNSSNPSSTIENITYTAYPVVDPPVPSHKGLEVYDLSNFNSTCCWEQLGIQGYQYDNKLYMSNTYLWVIHGVLPSVSLNFFDNHNKYVLKVAASMYNVEITITYLIRLDIVIQVHFDKGKCSCRFKKFGIYPSLYSLAADYDMNSSRQQITVSADSLAALTDDGSTGIVDLIPFLSAKISLKGVESRVVSVIETVLVGRYNQDDVEEFICASVSS